MTTSMSKDVNAINSCCAFSCSTPTNNVHVFSHVGQYYGYCQKCWETYGSNYKFIQFAVPVVKPKSTDWKSTNPDDITLCCVGQGETFSNATCGRPAAVVFQSGYDNTAYWGYCQKDWDKNGSSFKLVKNLNPKKTDGGSILKFPAKAIAPEYRTQKAVGLKALRDMKFHTPAFDIYGVEHFDFESPYDKEYRSGEAVEIQSRIEELNKLVAKSDGDRGVTDYLNYAKQNLEAKLKTASTEVTAKQLGMFPARAGLDRMVNKFVRPCPMVPRHGFVDSRPVKSIEEAEALLEETLRAEDRAEFIIMPFIKAEYSGIWTNGKLVIGTGNDGATAGHSSRLIPALGLPTEHESVWKETLQKGRITESPYVELLWAKKYEYDSTLLNYFVQLRNGPSLPDTIDFIPEETVVKSVVLAEGDLLEWETKAKTFTPGTVVYHPGGSLASHYAVHAVLSKTPVLVSRKPDVGEILKPNTEMKEPDVEAIRNGFYLGATTEMSFEDAAFVMLSGCHSTSVWLGRQDALLGLAMGAAYRLTVTAALGEYRHEPGRKRKPGRDVVYSGVWTKILASSTRTRFMKALDSFKNDKRWPGSFGGKKWYTFGSFAAAIFNSILDGDVQESLQNLNKCVNAVHNSGWGFDKFIDRIYMDQAAISPSVVILKVAPRLYDVILLTEKDATGGEWFKGKHHIDAEPLDEEAAKKDEEKEEEVGTSSNHLYQEAKDKEIIKKADKKLFLERHGYLPCECQSKANPCNQGCGVLY